MKCAICGRALLRPALSIGRMSVGPKCARRAGLIEPKHRTKAVIVDRDDKTADLFDTQKNETPLREQRSL